MRSGENSESDESESDEEKNAGMQRQRDREIDKDGSSCNRDFGDDLRPDVRPSACPRRFLAPKAGTKHRRRLCDPNGDRTPERQVRSISR